MPIYEFYCEDCNTVFSFLSRTMNPSKRPLCPECGRADLDRRMSKFAISSGRSHDRRQDDGWAGSDDAGIGRALEELAVEHDHLDHNDPRHAIPMIRGVYEIAGMPIPEKAQEAIRRIESGEDPDTIHADLGCLWDTEDSPFSETGSLHGFLEKLAAPRVDETLHDL